MVDRRKEVVKRPQHFKYWRQCFTTFQTHTYEVAWPSSFLCWRKTLNHSNIEKHCFKNIHFSEHKCRDWEKGAGRGCWFCEIHLLKLYVILLSHQQATRNSYIRISTTVCMHETFILLVLKILVQIWRYWLLSFQTPHTKKITVCSRIIL